MHSATRAAVIEKLSKGRLCRSLGEATYPHAEQTALISILPDMLTSPQPRRMGENNRRGGPAKGPQTPAISPALEAMARSLCRHAAALDGKRLFRGGKPSVDKCPRLRFPVHEGKKEKACAATGEMCLCHVENDRFFET